MSFGTATPFVSFLWAVGGGFASAAIATGSLKAGLWGAVSAAVFFGIGSAFQVDKFAAGAKAGSDGAIAAVKSGLTGGQTLAKIAAHAGAGGTLNVLQGGKFGHGFVSAGFTEVLSPAVGQIDGKDFGSVLSRTAVSAAIGGTASSLSGGSFANGAQTGAFQQLFSETAMSQLSAQSTNNDEPDDAVDLYDGFVKNGGFRDNVSVECVGNDCTIAMNFTYDFDQGLSPDTISYAIKGIKSYWAGAYVYGENTYSVTVKLTRAVRRPDIMLTSNSGVDFAGLAPQGGGGRLQLSSFYSAGTAAHEFGHMLGFNHRFNYTQSIMSYSFTRQVMGQDIDFLARQYGRRVP